MPNQATVEAVNRVTKLMTLYPCVYVILTLPLSASRMWSMAHHGAEISDGLACTAGALLASCGWVDSLLYTLTRKALLRDTMPGSGGNTGGSSGRRPSRGMGASDWDTELGSKGITHTRTVTVEGGRVMDMLHSASDSESRHGRRQNSRQNSDPLGLGGLRDPSPSGSIDPILSGRSKGVCKTETEITVGTTEVRGSEEEKGEGLSALPLWRRQRP